VVLDGMSSSDIMPDVIVGVLADVSGCIGVTGHFWDIQHQTNGSVGILSSKVAAITGIRSF
jgi:hypothetical protein